MNSFSDQPGAQLDEDDPSLSDDAWLLRLVNPKHVRVQGGKQIPKTAAFTNTAGTNAMSVFVREEFEASDHRADQLPELLGKVDYGVLAFTVRQVRRLGQGVVRQRLDGGPPGHAHVVGKKDKRTKTRFQGPLVRASIWVKEVPDPQTD